MGRKLWISPSGAVLVDRRKHRADDHVGRVYQAARLIDGGVRHTTDSDDAIVARALEVMRGNR